MTSSNDRDIFFKHLATFIYQLAQGPALLDIGDALVRTEVPKVKRCKMKKIDDQAGGFK